MIRLRPYKACDAQTITKWVKDEYAFRQWSADRYKKYPITSDDMNLYYDRDKNNEHIADEMLHVAALSKIFGYCSVEAVGSGILEMRQPVGCRSFSIH